MNIVPESLAHLTKFDRTAGILHIRKGLIEGTWLFNDTGRYAVIVQEKFLSSQNRLHTLLVYDCLNKEAYEYINENLNMMLSWFYWHGEFLVLVDMNDNKALYVFELNHDNRNARLIQVRYIPGVFQAYNIRTQSVVCLDNNMFIEIPSEQDLQPLKNYFPLYHKFTQTVFLLPKDPFSDILPQKFTINCPYTGYQDNIDGMVGEYSLYNQMMSLGSCLYFFKAIKQEGCYYVFRLDCLVKIDLTKLENIYGKKERKKMNRVREQQDLNAYSEIRLKLNQVPNDRIFYFLGYAEFASRLHSAQDGFQHFVEFIAPPNQPNTCFVFNLKTMEVDPFFEIERHHACVSESFHPNGQMLTFYYGEDCKIKCEMFWKMKTPVGSLKELVKQRLYFGEKPKNLENYNNFVDRFL